MSSQCPDFAEFSNLLFDVKEKLSDDEYMKLYGLLGKIQTLKYPAPVQWKQYYNRAVERTEAWKVYSKGLEATVLCLVGITLFVGYNTNNETMFALGLLGLIVVIPQLKS